MPTAPLTLEDAISQVPALQILQALGYTYLTPAEALALRRGKRRNVVLEDVLADWLRVHNTVRYKGQEVPFSEGNIAAAVQALTDVLYDGLVRTNEKVYDLLCLGKSLPQAVAGDPAFYKKFSALLQEAIDEFRAARLKAAEYLKKVTEIAGQMVHRTEDEIPAALHHRDVAKAYFGCINAVEPAQAGTGNPAEVTAEAAVLIDDTINRLRIVSWTTNTDVKNRMAIEIEDALFDLFARYERVYTFEQMDEIIEECLKVAKVRVP